MVGRSLQLSAQGQQQAKQALQRCSLTQKAIATELGIASWSTINRFFTGKPIDRFIFQEICQALNLDWQAVTQSTDYPEPHLSAPPPQYANTSASNPLLLTVRQQSNATREALTPRILERIPRSVVQEKYLGAIARGTTGGQQRVIAIIAPAGYGKSTILGEIYDELMASQTGWVGLILCSTLSPTASYAALPPYSLTQSSPSPTNLLDVALGNSLCGVPQSILEVTGQLSQQCGRGVLLIDTLDLVINREFVISFGQVLRRLNEQGVTVVFTCRDHEYNDYLEPVRERLPGLTHSIDRYTVPNFTTDEIRQAAATFFHKIEPDAPEQGQHFASDILALSADNRSLRDILQNPLLLALLCELFAREGNVPPDLTVSKLYQRYWYEKVAYSRADQSHFAPLALEKEGVCLAIAQTLFTLSQERLCESFYRDDLGLSFTESAARAYQDLLSEGVIEPLPSGKLHFFHQTLMEYAIAYWLTRHAAQAQRRQLLTLLNQPNATRTYTYWLPVLRQHLTILETEAEFEALVSTLNLKDVGIFGTVAYAAASRDRPDALLHLLNHALEMGEVYQKRLHQALEAAPRQLAEDAWAAMVALMCQGAHATAINAAKTLSILLSRWWPLLKGRLPEVLNAISNRSLASESQSRKGKGDDRPLLCGWLLQHCFPILREQVDVAVLSAIAPYSHWFGQDSLMALIQLHLLPAVPSTLRHTLLSHLLPHSLPGNPQLETTVTVLIATVLSECSPCDFAADFWESHLYKPRAKGWDTPYARGVGRCAVGRLCLLTYILQNTFCDAATPPQTSHFRLNYIALKEAIQSGSGSSVADYLVKRPVDSLHPICFKAMARFFREIGPSFPPADQVRLTEWLSPATEKAPHLILPILDGWADAAPKARLALQNHLSLLPPDDQARLGARLLRFQPLQTHPPLSTLQKEAQVALVKLYREWVQTQPEVLVPLLAACQSHFQEVALAASYGLERLPAGWVTVEDLVPLLHSRFAGIRVNSLLAVATVSDGGTALALDTLTHLYTVLAKENNQAVVRPMCELLTAWVKHHRSVPPLAAQVIGEIPQRLPQGSFDGGVARVLIAALKAIAQCEDPAIPPTALQSWIRSLLMGIDFTTTPHSEAEMIDVFSALARCDRRALGVIVREDCPILAANKWVRNISAVIRAIRRVETGNSPLLEEILGSSWCTQAIESIILEVRGA